MISRGAWEDLAGGEKPALTAFVPPASWLRSPTSHSCCNCNRGSKPPYCRVAPEHAHVVFSLINHLDISITAFSAHAKEDCAVGERPATTKTIQQMECRPWPGKCAFYPRRDIVLKNIILWLLFPVSVRKFVANRHSSALALELRLRAFGQG